MARADAQRSVDAIVDAAREVLATDPAASAQSIIDRAGVHRATFYRHFPSRESLADAIYDRFLDDVKEIHDRSRELDRPDVALEQVAAETIAEIEKNRLFLYIAPRGLEGETTEELAGYLLSRVKEAQEQGLIRRDESPINLLRAYSGMVVGMAIPPPGGITAEEKAALVMQVLRAPPLL